MFVQFLGLSFHLICMIPLKQEQNHHDGKCMIELCIMQHSGMVVCCLWPTVRKRQRCKTRLRHPCMNLRDLKHFFIFFFNRMSRDSTPHFAHTSALRRPSVGLSVGWLVGWLVGLSYSTFFYVFSRVHATQ